MRRRLLWVLPALLPVALVVSVVLWWQAGESEPVPAPEEPTPEEESTPTRVQTEDQMRSIGYVQ